MITFVFARCTSVCPALLQSLVQVQAASLSGGFADEFAFLPTTFDPEHDTAEVLEAYVDERGVDRTAGNWWTLRPASAERAQQVVGETFGVVFEFVPEEQREMDNMAWIHTSLVLLANADGYVERAYTGQSPTVADVIDDVRTLRDRW